MKRYACQQCGAAYRGDARGYAKREDPDMNCWGPTLSPGDIEHLVKLGHLQETTVAAGA